MLFLQALVFFAISVLVTFVIQAGFIDYKKMMGLVITFFNSLASLFVWISFGLLLNVANPSCPKDTTCTIGYHGVLGMIGTFAALASSIIYMITDVK